MSHIVADTLVHLLSGRVDLSGDKVAIHVPRKGLFYTLTWNEVARDVRRAAAALQAAGVQPGDRVAQISENRYEWIVTDLAVHLARGVHVAIHAALSGPQIAYQIAHSDARIVLLAGKEEAAKLSAVTLPENLKFFSYDEVPGPIAGQPVLPFAAAVAAVSDAVGLDIEKEAVRITRPTDLATILYSSGTTGEPKGVMLTHGNLASNSVATCEAFDVQIDDVRLCILPLSHIFARTCDMYTWLVRTSELALAECREAIMLNCEAIRPMLINGVPYFFERVMRFVVESGYADVPDVLEQLLGGRIRICCSGGAALPDHVADFFMKHNVPLLQGYGLTETSPVISLSTPWNNKLGTVGKPLANVDVKIADDGEILTRGPHVMKGYWKLPKATAEAIQDDWFHTGDIGHIDAEGFLKITGRKKEIIATAGGKKVAPVAIEALLTEDPLMPQAMIVGDGKKYLTALIVPNLDLLREELVKLGAKVSTDHLLTNPQVLELFRKRIDERLSGVSHYEQIGRFTLLEQPFAAETGELTLTLKPRRNVILSRYAAQINAMYDETHADVVESVKAPSPLKKGA